MTAKNWKQKATKIKVIKQDNVYEIEKILKKRGRGKTAQYLVKS